jgi:hypothetical protein
VIGLVSQKRPVVVLRKPLGDRKSFYEMFASLQSERMGTRIALEL